MQVGHIQTEHEKIGSFEGPHLASWFRMLRGRSRTNITSEITNLPYKIQPIQYE